MDKPTLTPAVKRFAAALMKQGADEISRHMCEDISEDVRIALAAMTQDERDAIMRYYHKKNGDPYEYKAGVFSWQAPISMMAIAWLLEEEDA